VLGLQDGCGVYRLDLEVAAQAIKLVSRLTAQSAHRWAVPVDLPVS
jgi:hypothetical protein